MLIYFRRLQQDERMNWLFFFPLLPLSYHVREFKKQQQQKNLYFGENPLWKQKEFSWIYWIIRTLENDSLSTFFLSSAIAIVFWIIRIWKIMKYLQSFEIQKSLKFVMIVILTSQARTWEGYFSHHWTLFVYHLRKPASDDCYETIPYSCVITC